MSVDLLRSPPGVYRIRDAQLAGSQQLLSVEELPSSTRCRR